MLTLLQTEDDEEQADRAQDDPDQIEAVGVRLEVRDEHPREDEADHADGKVDEEDPLPAEAVHEQASGERPDEHGDPGGRSPQAHRGAAALGREGAGDDGHRLRGHECGTQALDRAEDDQHLEGSRQATAQGCEREDREADEVDALRSESITQTAGDQQGHGVRQEVGRRDPHDVVEVVGGRVEGRLDGGVGHRDDGGVDQDHEEPDDERPEGGPRVAFGGGCGRGHIARAFFGHERAASLCAR